MLKKLQIKIIPDEPQGRNWTWNFQVGQWTPVTESTNAGGKKLKIIDDQILAQISREATREINKTLTHSWKKRMWERTHFSTKMGK